MVKHRSLVEDPVFAASKQALGASIERLDEILSGPLWTICRDPTESALVKKGSSLRLIFTRAFPDIPSLRILFRVENDDNTIALLDITVAETASNDDVLE